MGVFFGSVENWTPDMDQSAVCQGQGEGGSSERFGDVLCSTRLRHIRTKPDGEPCRRHENHGTQGCENCHAVSASRTRKCPCGNQRPEFTSQFTSQNRIS